MQFCAQPGRMGSLGSELIVKRLMKKEMAGNAFTFYSDDLVVETSKRKGSPQCLVCGKNSVLHERMTDSEISNWIFNWFFNKHPAAR